MGKMKKRLCYSMKDTQMRWRNDMVKSFTIVRILTVLKNFTQR